MLDAQHCHKAHTVPPREGGRRRGPAEAAVGRSATTIDTPATAAVIVVVIATAVHPRRCRVAQTGLLRPRLLTAAATRGPLLATVLDASLEKIML